MITKYKILFSITIKHTYYINEKCDDLELVPTPDCKRLMQNHRILLKRYPAVWTFIIQTDRSGVPIIPVNEETQFRFYIQLKNWDLLQYTSDFEEKKVTDFQEDVSLEKAAFKHWCYPWYYNDPVTDQSELTLEVYRHYRNEKHIVISPGTEEVFFLQGEPVPDRKNTDIKVGDLGSIKTASGYDPEMKTVLINTTGVAEEAEFTLEYWSSPPWPAGTFGLLDINISDSESKDFMVRLHAKKAQWKYYVVANSTKLSIENGFSFSKKEDPGDEIATELVSIFPEEAKVVLFTSEELSYQEEIIKGIRLHEEQEVKVEPEEEGEEEEEEVFETQKVLKVRDMPNPIPQKNGIEIVNIFREPS